MARKLALVISPSHQNLGGVMPPHLASLADAGRDARRSRLQDGQARVAEDGGGEVGFRHEGEMWGQLRRDLTAGEYRRDTQAREWAKHAKLRRTRWSA
jgi:hypothetical protein